MTDKPKLVRIDSKKDTQARENIEAIIGLIDEEDAVASIVIVLNRDGSWLHRESGDSVPISRVIGILEWVKADIIRCANNAEGG